MQPEQFLKLLHTPHSITPEEVQTLKNLLRRHPHFQIAHALLAKVAYDRDRLSADQAIQIAAVYATDRAYFKALLEDTQPFSASTREVMPATPIPEAGKIAKTRAYDFVNAYVNTIQQKAEQKITKKKSLAQLNSIQVFLQEDVNFHPQSLQTSSYADLKIDLTQHSTTFHDHLATETLAQILGQQGKLQRALAIYEKLILKFPEKKTYFANCIEQLKYPI
jgi:tetratricopeptide (TPR) repeat protein